MDTKYRDRLVLAGIGLLQGLSVLTISSLRFESIWINSIAYGLLSFIIFAGLVIQFLWAGKITKSIIGFSILTGLVFAICSVWNINANVIHANPLSRLGSSGAEASLFVALYLLIAHYGAYQVNQTFRYSYSDVFKRSWNNVFILFTTYTVTLLFFGVISLWASMSEMLKIKSIATFLISKEFLLIVLPTIGGFGIAIGKENDKLINVSRRMLLAIFGFIVPFFSIGIIVFVVLTLVQGPELVLSARMSTFMLPMIVTIGLLLINTIVQDISKPVDYSTWLTWIFLIMLLLLPILTTFSAYKIFTKDANYFNTSYLYERIFTAFLLFYSYSYAIAVAFRKNNLLVLIKPINIIASISIVLVLILINTPVLNVNRIAANAIYENVVSGKMNLSKYKYYQFTSLEYRLGKPGQQLIKDLLSRSDYPNASKVHALLNKKNKVSRSYQAANKDLVFKAENFKVVGASKSLPSSLLEIMKKSLSPRQYSKCKKNKTCYVVAYNIDKDEQLEYIIMSNTLAVYIDVFDLTKTGWKKIGRYHTKYTQNMTDKINKSIKNNEIRVLESSNKDLMIGNIRFKFR